MSPAVAVPALAATLAHFVWQGALVALVFAVARRALRHASPGARYAAAMTALAAMAAAPVVTFARVGRALSAVAVAHPVPVALAAASRPLEGADVLAPAVTLLWALGVAAMLVRLTGGALRVRALVSRGTELPAAWQALSRRLAGRLGVRRAVRVLGSADIEVPLTLGWLRPIVLWPAALLLDLPTPAVEALLAHELAHVRRHDWALNVVQSAVEALLFYHPAVWWVSACARAEREHCCDDAVVALTGDALGYARALVTLESTRREAALLSVAATGGSLMDRIERIVEGPPRPRRVALVHTLAVAAAFVVGAAAPLFSCAAPVDPGSPVGTTAAAAASLPPSSLSPSSLPPSWLPPAVSRWTPSFVAAGERHGVDPDLLAIVTLCESGGDPEARSPVGALGLMQVMPATASHIAAARGLPDDSPDLLRDPEHNIDFGAFYLAAQLRDFGTGQTPERAVALAAAAYNGGPDALRAHLTEGTPLSEETEHYQARVVALWRRRQAERL
jgi:beta-lactamase regulating signal transducer with metallopeptidase domain